MEPEVVIVVSTFYRFFPFPDFRRWQPLLKTHCARHAVKGTILLAPEGINSAIAGPKEGIDAVLAVLKADPRLYSLESKESLVESYPFHRMKVRLKKEIITMGGMEVEPHVLTGTHVSSEEWNILISDPPTVVIDVRNDYEVRIGSFKNAINPHMATFGQFPSFVKQQLGSHKHRRIAMSCTGGIRCEKASSYLLAQGFKEVYQLQGGILKYLQTVSPEENLWEGECFVFDSRVALKEGAREGNYELCYGCRAPIGKQDKEAPEYEEGVSCPHCFSYLTPKKCARTRERHRQVILAKRREVLHVGAVFESQCK